MTVKCFVPVKETGAFTEIGNIIRNYFCLLNVFLLLYCHPLIWGEPFLRTFMFLCETVLYIVPWGFCVFIIILSPSQLRPAIFEDFYVFMWDSLMHCGFRTINNSLSSQTLSLDGRMKASARYFHNSDVLITCWFKHICIQLVSTERG